MTYPSDNNKYEEEAKAVVLNKFLGAQENPYGDKFVRPGLVFAPFLGGWCKIGENWQDAKRQWGL